jgi:hypothetical protein
MSPFPSLASSPQAAAPAPFPEHAARASAAGRAPRSPGTFLGAALPICGVEVLLVVVRPWVLADIHEANLFVVAFHERFRRAIVLVAQRPDGAPCFYGPTEIVRVLQGLPFELIPWRRFLLHPTPPPGWRLPLPLPLSGASSAASATAADAEVIALPPARHRTTVR